MQIKVRYQAAMIQNDHLLLLKVNDRISGQTFWVIPGGGQEANETEEACVRREVFEETHLSVEVDRLVLDEQAPCGDFYHRNKTYRCQIMGGQARPGSEPEVDTAEHSTISEVGWFDMRNPAT